METMMMTHENTSNSYEAVAEKLTGIFIQALHTTPADDVVLGAMAATLAVSLEVVPRQDVVTWLRGLADQVEAGNDLVTPMMRN